MKKRKQSIVYAFIDSQNLNLGVRSQGWYLDWRKFRQYLRNKYNTQKAYLFIGHVPGNVDAELVLHTMIQFNNYDKAIIVSGDGDFHCLVEYLANKGKLLKILAPTTHYSSLLRKFNTQNYIVRIDLLRNSLEQKKTGIRGRSKP